MLLLSCVLFLHGSVPIQAQSKIFFTRGSGFWTVVTDENKQSFFEKLTPSESQREDWYVVTPYVAEFWCMISNIGLLGIGLYDKSPALVCAGLASVLSHSIPKQWLLYIDKIAAIAAVLSVVSKVIKDRNIVYIMNNPFIVLPTIGLAIVGISDLYLARYKGKTVPHVIWHLCAAIVSHCVLCTT